MKLSGVHVLFIVIGVAVLVWTISRCKLKCGIGEGYMGLRGLPGYDQAYVDYLPTVGAEPTGEGGFVDMDAAYDPKPLPVFSPTFPGYNYRWWNIPASRGIHGHYSERRRCKECVARCMMEKHTKGADYDKRSEMSHIEACAALCSSRCS